MSRLLLGAGMVAAAWALAITGLIFVGDAEAGAAWAKTGPGSAAAKAIRIGTPGKPTVSSTVCTGNGPYSISLQWSPTLDSPPTYEIFAAANKNATPVLIGTTTEPSANLTNVTTKPSLVSVRATAGTWRSSLSLEANGC